MLVARGRVTWRRDASAHLARSGTWRRMHCIELGALSGTADPLLDASYSVPVGPRGFGRILLCGFDGCPSILDSRLTRIEGEF